MLYFCLNLFKVYQKSSSKQKMTICHQQPTDFFCSHGGKWTCGQSWAPCSPHPHSVLEPKVAPHSLANHISKLQPCCPGPTWAIAPYSHGGGVGASIVICPFILGLCLTPFSELLRRTPFSHHVTLICLTTSIKAVFSPPIDLPTPTSAVNSNLVQVHLTLVVLSAWLGAQGVSHMLQCSIQCRAQC